MRPRDTATGGVLEAMILPALEGAGYALKRQVRVGERLGGGRHVVDVVATASDGDVLVSLKWQQVSGTAEDKVPFEVMCLAEALGKGPFVRAWLVLGGDGWKRRDFYTSPELHARLRGSERVRVVTLERFIALANRAQV